MNFRTWLDNLKSAHKLDELQHRRRPRARRKPVASLRLRLESLEDRFLLSTVTVTNTSDSGAGPLRAAITQVNADPKPGADQIKFVITGTGPFVIQPLSALPVITHPAVIDGYTQKGG